MLERLCQLATLMLSLLCVFTACDSTETGNPPVIDGSKLFYEFAAAEGSVSITGAQGAVSPASATVEALDVSRGDAVVGEAPVNADGSFQLVFRGPGDHSYAVRAVGSSGVSSPPTVPSPVGDAGSPEPAPLQPDGTTPSSTDAASGPTTADSGTPKALSCADRTSAATAALDQALAQADRSCQTSADCMPLQQAALISCALVCTDAYGSKQGADAVAKTVDQLTTGVCAGFVDDGCEPVVTPCVSSTTAVCLNNQCAASSSRTVAP